MNLNCTWRRLLSHTTLPRQQRYTALSRKDAVIVTIVASNSVALLAANSQMSIANHVEACT